MQTNHQAGNIRIILPILFLAVLIGGLVIVVKTSQQKTQISSQATTGGQSTVVIKQGRLNVDGKKFLIRGIVYHPVPIGWRKTADPAAPPGDIPKIADLGVNTLTTYRLEGDSIFYQALYPMAQQYNLKIIIGFGADNYNWRDPNEIAKATASYQQLVKEAKTHPSTLMYRLGNEMFPNLKSDVEKRNYAKWVGKMVDWTRSNDSNHPTAYSEASGSLNQLSFLKQYAPNLQIIGINDYSFVSQDKLKNFWTGSVQSYWDGKYYYLNEYGSDSYDNVHKIEDQTKQANRLLKLAQTVDGMAKDGSVNFLGGSLFRYEDVWSEGGHDPNVHETFTVNPQCVSCFDGMGNLEYWGIAESTLPSQEGSRIMKTAYNTLQQFWKGNK